MDHFGTILQFSHQLNSINTHNIKNKRVNIIKLITENIENVNWFNLLINE